MREDIRHIGWLLGGMLMLLLLMACSSSLSEDDETGLQPKEKPVLKLYIFAPESPIVTRSDNGNVNATADEKALNTFDVWVFETGTSTLVSYLHLSNQTFDGQQEITMEVSDDFADKAQKPNVDIFVAANVAASNCGLSLQRSTTSTELQAAAIAHTATGDYFGLTAPVLSVPVEGLPISGMLTDQVVSGTAPVFTAKTNNVKLVRAVSKIRFVFSKSTSAPEISNLSVKLNSGVLPTKEFLFLDGIYPDKRSRIDAEAGTEGEQTLISGVSDGDINAVTDPAQYATYTVGQGQAYETKINGGIENKYLSELGRFYLRESEEKLKGTVNYTLGGTAKSANFEMKTERDFTRNHTWIVYGYFLGSGDLMLNLVDVKSWTDKEENNKVHNW